MCEVIAIFSQKSVVNALIIMETTLRTCYNATWIILYCTSLGMSAYLKRRLECIKHEAGNH